MKRNTLRPRQDGRHFPDNIFKYFRLNENARILIIMTSLKFVPTVTIINIPSSVQRMAWCRSVDKPLSGPMMALFTEICMRHSAPKSWLGNVFSNFRDLRAVHIPQLSWWLHQIWRHHFPRYWPFVPVNSPHKGQWHGAVMFSLIYAWMNCWVNDCEAGDLRR